MKKRRSMEKIHSMETIHSVGENHSAEKVKSAEDDLTSRLPLRDNVRNIKNLFVHVYRIDKTYYFLDCLRLFLDAVGSALTVVLAADILEMLYESRPMEEIMKAVIFLLALPTLTAMLSSALLNEFVLPGKKNIARVYNGNLAAKFLHMDYSLVNSPYVKDMQDRIDRAHSHGDGIYDLFKRFDAIAAGFFNLVCSLVVAYPMLRIIVNFRNPLMYLGIVILAALLWILTSAAVKADAAFQERFLANPRDLCPEELYRKYYSFSWYWVRRCMSGEYHFIKDIHLYGGHDMMKKYTADNARESENVMHWTSVLEKLSGRSGFLNGSVGSLLSLAGYLVSAAYALMGAFSVGNVIKFAESITKIAGGAQSMGQLYRELSLTARREASTLEMLRISDEMYKGRLPVEKRLDNQYEIEFRNVSFRYPGAKNDALKNLSLKLRIGERMAIVGMNGSGKTTMIKLLCRLYDPQEGEILLNGVDIRKFRQEEYIRLFSVVFQDFKLLSLPLGQNVASSTKMDRELAVKALGQAGLGERLEKLPEGLDTFLYQDIADDGVEISGGEAQKIAIARALYKDSPFVLLDEPTASLDPLSEYEIYSRFDSMVKDKTAVYISHRLSSCRFCDDIAVFHEGRLVQRGSHEELLLDEQGKYYELWRAQAQYYTEK